MTSKNKNRKVLRSVYISEQCCYLCGLWTSNHMYTLHIESGTSRHWFTVCGTCIVALHRSFQDIDPGIAKELPWDVVDKKEGT